ncbi:5'-nucleotidase C-terminal domain-containing protein [Holophaga foetida]|uniref:5'-nucleotidase C-terminal domain-containing protein n=1 Tax=Holophaga foetida TaxID=35839 RepID=UPI00024721A9|nr:5'-nucleotidase [Holophaga foetida]
MVLSSLFLSGALAILPSAGTPTLAAAQPEAVTPALPEDPAVAQALAPCAAIIRKEFSQVLAQASKRIPRGKLGEENLLGYWVTDLMRERASRCLGQPVAFAFINSGGLRADLQAGPVRVADIFELMPFDNELVVTEYTGREVLQLLRGGLIKKAGEPCSGVLISLQGTPERPVVSASWLQTAPLDPETTVLIATTDYLLASGDGLPTRGRSKKVIPTGLQIRQILLEACAELGSQGKSLPCPAPGRYSFAPGMLEALLERRIAW